MPVTTPAVADVATLDLGRHRLYSAFSRRAGESEAVETHPIGTNHDGLFLRYYSEDGTERFTERLQRRAGTAEAAALTRDLARFVSERIVAAPRLVVAVPASFGRLGRQAVLDGFAASGTTIAPSDLVDRPVAALAGWFAHRTELSGFPPKDPVLLIDNDGGALSAAVADPATQRLLLSIPLSIGTTDSPSAVERRLRRVLVRAAALTHRDGIVAPNDWPSVSATIGQVVVTGSGSQHPWLQGLIARLLPAADVMPDPITSPEKCVSVGLAHLSQFQDWTACWPTLAVRAGGDLVRSAGAVFDDSSTSPTETIVVPRRSTLSFELHGSPALMSAASAVGTGVSLPASLGTMPVVRFLDDGRLLVLGPQGVIPLTMQVGWPCPGTPISSVGVEAIGRRAITLVTDDAVRAA